MPAVPAARSPGPRPRMPAVPAAWPLLLLLAAQLGRAAAGPQLWQCAPCSPEKLARCPPVPASCQEQARPYGCGCCSVCTLPEGANCGLTSARCAQGLKCQALPGEARPLQALSRGKGACLPEVARAEPSAEAVDAEEESTEQLPPLWSALSNYESIAALGISNIKNWKDPCQRELYDVLNKLAQEQQAAAGDRLHKFYLPNCHKNGMYHSKQCETSLTGEIGFCWCVYPWNGQRIPGSVKVQGDPNCHQYFQRT